MTIFEVTRQHKEHGVDVQTSDSTFSVPWLGLLRLSLTANMHVIGVFFSSDLRRCHGSLVFYTFKSLCNRVFIMCFLALCTFCHCTLHQTALLHFFRGGLWYPGKSRGDVGQATNYFLWQICDIVMTLRSSPCGAISSFRFPSCRGASHGEPSSLI